MNSYYKANPKITKGQFCNSTISKDKGHKKSTTYLESFIIISHSYDATFAIVHFTIVSHYL